MYLKATEDQLVGWRLMAWGYKSDCLHVNRQAMQIKMKREWLKDRIRKREQRKKKRKADGEEKTVI